MDINNLNMNWTYEPSNKLINENKIEITTEPGTDLWQRTYYHFRNDNAPMLQLATDKKYFTFEVKTICDSSHRYDQCGIVMYLNSDNWIKASAECDNNVFQHIGAVVTNNGFSDWSSEEIDASLKTIWFRLSRRDMDFKIEYSIDGIIYKQLRICHMFSANEKVNFGVYACSPEQSSFKATFTDLKLLPCLWQAHDGQKPDEDIDY